MIKSYTVIGANNYKLYHVQAYGPSQARRIFKEQTGKTAMNAVEEK